MLISKRTLTPSIYWRPLYRSLVCVSAEVGPSWRKEKKKVSSLEHFNIWTPESSALFRMKTLTTSPPACHTSGSCLPCQSDGRRRCWRTSTPRCRCTAWPWICRRSRTRGRRCRRCPRRRSPLAFLPACGCPGPSWICTSRPSSRSTWGSLRVKHKRRTVNKMIKDSRKGETHRLDRISYLHLVQSSVCLSLLPTMMWHWHGVPSQVAHFMVPHEPSAKKHTQNKSTLATLKQQPSQQFLTIS